jgi:hypothetical protein
VIGSLLLIGLLGVGQADEGIDQAVRLQVVRLVRELDDDQLDRREAAERGLIALGPDVLDLLPPVTRRTSAEAKVRLERIRRALEQAAAEAAAQASVVTLSGTMLLSEAFAAVEKQTGNKIVDWRKRFHQQQGDPQVTVDFAKTPFWAALDDLLDQARMTVYNFGGEPGAVTVIARTQEEFTRVGRATYSGLFRFEGTRLQAIRDLRNPANQSLRLSMEVAWEPRISPIVLQVPLDSLEAIDDQGNQLTIDDRRSRFEVPVESNISASELVVPLALPPRTVQSIGSLKGTLWALVPGAVEAFEFGDLQNARSVQQRRAGVTVILDQVRRNADLHEVRIRVQFDKAQNALESHRGWIYNNDAYLLDSDGNRVEHAGLQATRQAETEVGVAYLLEDIEGGLEGCKFVYKTPAAIVKMPVKYELKDIQLP